MMQLVNERLLSISNYISFYDLFNSIQPSTRVDMKHQAFSLRSEIVRPYTRIASLDAYQIEKTIIIYKK